MAVFRQRKTNFIMHSSLPIVADWTKCVCQWDTPVWEVNSTDRLQQIGCGCVFCLRTLALHLMEYCEVQPCPLCINIPSQWSQWSNLSPGAVNQGAGE